MRTWGSRGDRREQPAAAGVVGGGSLELRSFAGGAGDRSMMISPIMLRFRPIAPKPALGDPFSGASQAEGPGGAATWRRVKRKCRVRVQRKNIRRRNSSRSDVAGGGTGSGEACKAAMMRLLSAKEDGQAAAAAGSDGHRQDLRAGFKEIRGALKVGGGAVGAPDREVVESRVTVESVGGAYMGAGDSLGLTDVERLRSLELDPCPAFVTDTLNRVRWLNAAYVRLVASGEGEGADVRVQVAAKGELPLLSGAFTCQVRVEHTWRDRRYSKLVPCDVWRLDWGGFAWWLDVKAALSLGF